MKVLNRITKFGFEPLGKGISFYTENSTKVIIDSPALYYTIGWRSIFSDRAYFICKGKYSINDGTMEETQIAIVHDEDFAIYGFTTNDWVKVIDADINTGEVTIKTTLSFGLSISEDDMRTLRRLIQELNTEGR